MKRIKLSSLPAPLREAILHPDPIEGEDVLIEDDSGIVKAAVVQPEAYQFLVRALEERENEVDTGPTEEYDPEGKTLDALIEETEREK